MLKMLGSIARFFMVDENGRKAARDRLDLIIRFKAKSKSSGVVGTLVIIPVTEDKALKEVHFKGIDKALEYITNFYLKQAAYANFGDKPHYPGKSKVRADVIFPYRLITKEQKAKISIR